MFLITSSGGRGRLKGGSAAACWLGLWIRMPPGAWIFLVSVVYCKVERGLCDGPILRPEETYRMCVTECVQMQN